MRRRTFAMLAELEASQWIDRSAMALLQERRLNRLLAVALAHCPWHAQRLRESGLAELIAGQAVTRADLLHLPTMNKADARNNAENIVWRGVPGGAYPYNTGGSSGEPLRFHFGRERQASDAAGRMRARRWWGVEVGDREAYLWGAPVELSRTDRIKTLRDRAINQLVLNAFEMSPAQMDAYMQAIEAWQPACIYGYASSIALLAAHAEARGRRLSLPGLRVVCTTGEPLYAHQRELIRYAFGAPVANEFGSRDIGFTAHETPAGQMLVLSENIFLEVLDAAGQRVAPGTVGEAVITGLVSDAQPFIRYRTGDMLALAGESCRDGRGIDVIGEVAGRHTDFVVRADGTIMHALAVIYILRAVAGIGQFKCIQHAPDAMEVLVVPDRGWSDECRARIATGLRARLGAELRVDCRVLDVIPAEASGKYRYVVSHVPLAGALRSAVGQAG